MQIKQLRQTRVSAFAKGLLFLAAGCSFCAGVHAQDPVCQTIPSGRDFWIRLSQPVSSYSSKAGSSVAAVLISPPQCGVSPVFSAGTPVHGKITNVRRVGMGIIHGSSAMTIDFDQIFAGDTSLPIKTHVAEIANGRESVNRGTIEGIGAENTPQRLLSTRLIHLPYWEPDAYWIFMVRRAVFPFSPEPEIYLPAGTELRLELTSPLQIPADLEIGAPQQGPPRAESIAQQLRAKLLSLPGRSVTGSGKPSDVVNLAFLGSPQQIQAAFRAAGWTYGDAVSTQSVLREMLAISAR